MTKKGSIEILQNLLQKQFQHQGVVTNDIKIEMEKLYLNTDINGLYYPNDEGMRFIGKYMSNRESSLRKSLKEAWEIMVLGYAIN